MSEERSGVAANEELSIQDAARVLPPQTLGAYITQIMKPVMETVSKLLENNTAALEQLSAAQSIQNDRLEALEKQIRLQTPVTAKQVTYINEAIRDKARELLDKYERADDAKAVKKLGNAIRKAVLSRYGVSCLHEIPRHEYYVAIGQIGMWSNALTVRDIVREAKEREREDQQNPRLDGA